jgi:hypothetical protein
MRMHLPLIFSIRSSTRTQFPILVNLDHENDSHKIRHKFFKRLRQIELATYTSSSEKLGSIHFAALFEIMAT